MSEGDSPHGALSDSETNNSIIHKVRSRVSSIIPNSFSKWFSPSSKPDGKNGSNRRRREISQEQDSSNEESYNQEDENISEPPVKRTKCDILEQSSTSLIEDPLSPSTSRIHNQNNSTRSTFETRTTTVSNSRKLASTPSSSLLLNRNRRYLGLNKTGTSTPYDFTTMKLSNAVSNFEDNSLNNIYSNNNLDSNQYSRGLDVRKRMKLDSIGGRSSITTNNNYDRNMLNTRVASGIYRKNNKSFNINNNNLEEELAGSDILGDDDDDDEDEVDELTLPIEEVDGERKFNGIHGTPSESEGSICSFTERPSSSADILNLNDDGKGIYRNRMSLKNAKTGIHFSSHLQSEKSLFSDKNLSSGLTNSSMSLNSWNRRPSFNASLYGSTSALSDSRLLNVKSPFYDGQTIYGGASTYAKNISRMQKALRVPVQIRPVSSLSTSSSTNTSNNNPVLSNTAKRILDLMNQFNVSSPLNDAKKMGNTLSSRVPPLSLARHNHIVEDELNLNRSIRLNSATSPYTRPDNKITRPVNKSLTTELQIPSVSHLLQIKRLQNKTEELRQLANESKSILNTNKTTTEYKLPANDSKDSDMLNNNSNKHTNKIKNKISATRPDKKQTNDDEPPTPVNLPNISFPAMKSVPQFNIALPAASKSDSSRPPQNNLSMFATSKINSNAVLTPKLGIVSSPTNLLKSENFKFELPNKSLISASLSNNVNKKTNAVNAEFSFSEPIQVSESVKVSEDSTTKSVDVNFEFRKPIPILKKSDDIKADKTSLSMSNKRMNTGSAIPTFNFNENLDTNKSINPLSVKALNSKEIAQTPKISANNEISKPKVELKTGSVMDVLMKFKNEQVKTDDAIKEKTLTPPKEIKPLADIFKQKTGTWECDACMVRNDSNLNKCLACETPKPGTQNNSSSIPSNPFNKLFDGLVKDDLFKKLVEKQNEKWECSTCDTRNDSSRPKCICCEQAKPGVAISDSTFPLSSDAQKFSFGIPAGTPVSVVPIAPLSSSSATTSVAPSFTFGIPPTATVSSAKVPSFTFGNGVNSPPSATTNFPATTVPPTGFSFGTLKPVDKVDAPNAVNTNDKNEDIKSKPTVTSLFGSPVSTSSVSLSNNTIKPESSSLDAKPPDSLDTSKKTEAPTFMFGVTKSTKSPVVQSALSENTIASATTTNTNSLVGGFKFTPPNNSSPSTSNIVSTNIDNTPLNSIPVTVASDSTIINQQVNSTFGQTSGFSLFKKPESSSSMAITSLVTKADTKPVVTFGSPSQMNKVDSPAAPRLPTDVKPVTGSFVFGTPTNSTVGKTENIFGTGTINPAPPVTTSTTTFGSPAGCGFSTATTTNTSVTSPFSAFGSNASTPTVGFGIKVNPTSAPTFGSFGGGNLSYQPAVTTNSSITHAASPVFESFGATQSSPALDSTNNSTFGQSSKIFGAKTVVAETPSTGVFGNTSGNMFGQNTISATFGSQPTQSNFGSQPTTALPTFGSTATPFNPPIQQNDSVSAVKNVFQFGGAQQTNEQPPPSHNLFQFGAANNSNNSAPKASFNFSTSTPPSFNFSHSTQPFTFGAAEPQSSVASGGFNFNASSTEVASNSPFQFGASPANNPFAATPAGPPRRKVKSSRRIR